MAPARVAPRQHRLSAAVLGALLDAAVDAIVMIDSDGSIVTFNRAAERLFGYAQDEVLGEPVQVLMPEPYRGEHPGYLRRYLETGEKRIIGIGREAQGRNRDGRVFPVWLSIGEAGAGRERCFVAIIRDLTDQRVAEEERHELEARLAHVGRHSLMGEMAAGITHEINQPLSAIVTYSHAAQRLLDNPVTDREALMKACAGIGAQAHRASQVIENLRNFIRNRDVEKELCDLNRVIDDAMMLVLTDTNRAGIAVKTDFAAGLPRVEANAIQLQQVLLNLTHNAVDAMQSVAQRAKGLTIRTYAPRTGEGAFEVRDHGPGVSPRLGEAIFRPFVTTKTQGLGVGLAISRTIIHNHGGRLTYNDAPGGGAVFTAALPAATEASSD